MSSQCVRPLSPEPLAPWAMPMPGAPRMSVGELSTRPDDSWQYELIDGRLVRMPPGGGEASRIALCLGGRLLVYVEEHRLGEVTGADGGYDLGPSGFPDTELGPDVAFVRGERVPPRDSPAYRKAWPVAPDLAVEVASPNQYRPEMAAKARLYMATGTRLGWVVWPRARKVDIWHPGDEGPSATLGIGDSLAGEDAASGFSYPLADLFRSFAEAAGGGTLIAVLE